ncbi:MAG: hypothetical protein JWR05_1412 [Mucilaginibacter sp.]|nr:hypothetical protein [Mucilaginibacter sp.]
MKKQNNFVNITFWFIIEYNYSHMVLKCNSISIIQYLFSVLVNSKNENLQGFITYLYEYWVQWMGLYSIDAFF